MTIWESEIKELDKLYDSFKGYLPDIVKELEQLIKTQDANVVMLYSRRCLEVIITDLCEIELKRPRKTEPLKGIIDKLNSEEKVPSHIISSMLSLNSMSTYGTHPKDFDPQQVKPVLNNLAIIIRWYLKYKDFKITSKTTAGKEENNNLNHSLKENYKPKKRKILLASGLLLGIIIIVYLVINFFGSGNINWVKDQDVLEKIIAVLPFENMSDNEDNLWLGDAMTDEIITQLYKIEEFIVRPRASVMQYKGTVRSPKDIGHDLKVNYLVSGSVQRIEDDIKIRVQLINSVNNIQIWGENFEGNWKDIAKIQSDIAIKVADKLKMALTPEERIQLNKKATENPEAFNYYMRGNEYYKRSFKKENFEFAAKMYINAIDLDPDFALAYVKLSDCYLQLNWFYYDNSIDRLAKSKAAIDAAFAIDQNLPEAHLAMGNYYYLGFLDYIKALQEVNIAEEKLKNNSECLYLKANIYRRAGEFLLSIESYLKAFEIDPSSAVIAHNIGVTYSLLKEYQKAEEYFIEAVKIRPTFIEAIWQKSFLYWKWDGNTIQSRKTIEEAYQYNECKYDPLLFESTVINDIYDLNYPKAITDLSSNDIDFIFVQFYVNLKSLLYARVYSLMNMPEKAKDYYSKSKITLDSMILKNPEDSRLYSALGISYAGMGKKTKAIEAGKKGLDLMPINKEAYRGVFRAEDLAKIYVMVGEYDAALLLIKELLDMPSRLSVKLLLLDPVWKPLWNLPEFKKITGG